LFALAGPTYNPALLAIDSQDELRERVRVDGSGEATARDAEVEVELARLSAGSRGRVVRVVTSGAEGERMQALGLCEGRLLHVLRSGDPLIVRVHGSRFGIAAERARGIFVRLEHGSGGAGR
jgi:Fe2+ transport system protein FeoA